MARNRWVVTLGSRLLSVKDPVRPACLLLATVAAFLALSGCGAMKVKLGMRVDLTQIPASSIDVALTRPGLRRGKISAGRHHH
jgi:hypothetical protein